MERDLGNLGEAQFEAYCHGIGITPNKVQIDKTGWDFLVEFPDKAEANGPLDLAPIPIRAYVQVKSSESDRRGSQVKVSNLKRFLGTNEPCFFIFMIFSKSNEPKGIYLVHFDEALISRTLKKLRELSLKGESQLNKKSLLVTYNESNKVKGSTSESLYTSLTKHLPQGLHSYREWKKGIIENIGYENNGRRFEVTFPKSDLKKIVDSTLYKESKVPFDTLKIYDERFGIPIELKDLSTKNGNLFFTKIDEKKLRSCFIFEGKKFWFEVTISSSPFEQGKNITKTRIDGKIFDLIISFDTHKASFTPLLQSKEAVEIITHSSFAQVLKNVYRSKTGEFRIQGPTNLRLGIDFNDHEAKEDLRQFIDASMVLDKLCTHLELPKSQKVSPSDIYEARLRIMILYETLLSEKRMMMTEFTADAVISDGRKMTTTIALFCPLGQIGIGIFMSVYGKVEPVRGNVHRLTPETSTIHDADFFERTDKTNIQIHESLTNLEKELSTSNKNYLFMDKRAIVLD
ncbi:DUF4365 domain-containing protein [Roseivirga sp. E12]|uniref:DUF4365 domain-containing protein n=1 Tax=Roseivirga sp. E12 TaxID=2819237 RepID=UPI001ABBE326|nr:DUF4365 domain-containing protein [Roseivirga sp. E12]MBO3699404.1 DUF4365 domain-containing protein [Roseivirga sp. E12]